MSLLLAMVLSGPTASTAHAQAAVLAADKERCAAVAARDAPRFFSLLSEEAAFFADGMPVAKGKEAVGALLRPFFDAKGPAMRCEPQAVEASKSADLAYVTGTFDVTGTEADRSPTRGHGKYVTIWRKRERAWKLVLAIGNSEPPAQPDFGPPPPP